MNEKKATRDELADAALDHYQRLADEACEHHSAEMRARIAALEEENDQLRRRHVGTDLSIEEILVDLCENVGYSEVMLVMECSDKLLELKRREEESE
ncbi:MAG: hypothetical protein ACTSP1_19990 [Candidatus Freyarchaeota archaeon]